MTMQLATPNNALMTTQYIPVAGLDTLSPDEFQLPTLKLTQAQSTADGSEAHLGEWYRKDTSEWLKSPAVLILGIAKSRVLFAPEFAGEQSEPLCRSDNAENPRKEFIDQQIQEYSVTIPPACADCPLSMWGSEGEPPACRLSENWAALTSDGDPVVIRLSRSAAKASAQLKNMARAAALKRRPLYVKLGSRYEKGEKGKYYLPVISAAGDPSSELLEMAAQFSGLNLAARAAAMDEEPETSTTAQPAAPPSAPLQSGIIEMDQMPF